MQIERIALALRRRTPWEALDLGHAMLRAWAGPAYRAWFATYGAFGLVLLAIFWTQQHIAILLLWWLKPLFDRVLLFTYSRSLFQTPTSLRELWRALPGIVRHTGLFSALTLRRLSFARSFLLPVWQLEGQTGAAARSRFTVLSRRTRGVAVWLTFVCANVSGILWFSAIFLAEVLTPMEAGEAFSGTGWFGAELPEMRMVTSLFVLLAESLVEPFYVASGFALYLNRRSELEGWDIELAFRRLAERQAPSSGRAGVSGVLAFFVLGAALVALPPPLWAQTDLPVSEQTPAQSKGEAKDEAKSAAKKTVERVLADPVFGKKVQETRWHRRAPEKDPASRRFDSLFSFIEALSQMMKGLVWIVGIALAVALVYLIIVYRARWWPSRRLPPPPDFLFGLDVRPDSLPADLVAAARAALAAGKTEVALSLLYRGALVALIHHLRVEFEPGDTEKNCQQRVDKRLEPPVQRYFSHLLDAWRATAYARQPPPLPVLEALCDHWSRHFAAPEALQAKGERLGESPA